MSADICHDPWTEKYRPTSLEHMEWRYMDEESETPPNNEVTSAPIALLKKFVSEEGGKEGGGVAVGRFPHTLFYGPPGTGKTSAVMALTRTLYGSSSDVCTMWINASDERDGYTIRNRVIDFVKTKGVLDFASNSAPPFKMVVLDECDAMTIDAQFALRNVLEKGTRNCRFCLICNYLSKVIPAIRSRCLALRFPPLPVSYIRNVVSQICRSEGVVMESEDTMDAMVTLGRGDLRLTTNHLQSCALAAQQRSGPPRHSLSPPLYKERGPSSSRFRDATSCVISNDSVYESFDKPCPEHVHSAVMTLMNEDLRVRDKFEAIWKMKMCRGFSLLDLVVSVFEYITTSGPFVILHVSTGSMDRSMEAVRPAKWRQLIIDLSDLEYALTKSTNERLQLGGICAAFVKYNSTSGDK